MPATEETSSGLRKLVGKSPSAISDMDCPTLPTASRSWDAKGFKALIAAGPDLGRLSSDRFSPPPSPPPPSPLLSFIEFLIALDLLKLFSERSEQSKTYWGNLIFRGIKKLYSECQFHRLIIISSVLSSLKVKKKKKKELFHGFFVQL